MSIRQAMLFVCDGCGAETEDACLWLLTTQPDSAKCPKCKVVVLQEREIERLRGWLMHILGNYASGVSIPWLIGKALEGRAVGDLE